MSFAMEDDKRFKPGADMLIAQQVYEVILADAEDTHHIVQPVLHNHSSLLLAIATYVAALSKGFGAFSPQELKVSINNLEGQLAIDRKNLSSGYAMCIQSVLDEYKLFAARLA